MIVEPVPTSPGSPLRRAARWIGVVLPPVLLVTVVAGGLLGQRPGAGPAGGATTPPTTTSAPVATAATAPAAPTAPAYPAAVAGLGVRTVAETLALHASIAPDRVLAVAGYLRLPTATSDCPGDPPGRPGPMCERRGLLVEQPATGGGGVSAPIGAHLHPRFPVGVRLPPAIAQTTPQAGDGTLPVVLLGRFEADDESCRTGGPGCGERFRVDRVAWADGSAFPSSPVIDAGVDSMPADWILQHEADAEVAAVGRSGTVLVSALLRPGTLARVDAAAGAALDALPPPAGLVWFVRSLEIDDDPTRYPIGRSPPRLRWIVLDDVTDKILARGVEPAQLSR